MPHHLGDLKIRARTAVVTGNPDRVADLADALGPCALPWSRRGYVCIEAEHPTGPVLVASGGIGGPTTAILVEELWQLGVRQIVRVGTCGSMQPWVRAGDLVISCGAVRDEGTSGQYLPASVPAVPDPEMLASIAEAARRAGVRHHVGLTHSKDAYYAEMPDDLPLAAAWRERWAALRMVGVLGTEMEAAALFAVATVRRFRAAGIFVPTDDALSAADAIDALRTATDLAVIAAAAVRGRTS
ncbi:MAG: uridine phosphorylase [Pseudonocardia sp.]|nr:uridine phosphorylase [Pseudonocardia sp.]